MSWLSRSTNGIFQDFPVFSPRNYPEWQRGIGFLIGGALFFWTVRKICVKISRKNKKKRNLRNQVVCLTGATGGLGTALAHVLWKKGAKTILIGRNFENLRKLEEEAKNFEKNQKNQKNQKSKKNQKNEKNENEIFFPPVFIQMDLSDLNCISAKSKEIIDVFGHVDVFIHNAGVSSRGSFLENDFSVDFDLMKTNYLGPVALTKEILPKMLEKKSGILVGIGSVQGKFALPFRSSYSASKHAFQAFFDSLRPEIQNQNVQILVVNPGYIKTALSLNALRGKSQKHAKLDEKTANGKDPKIVAEKIVEAIENGEKEILICDLAPKIAIIIRAICPSLYFYLMSKRAEKLRNSECNF